MNNAFCDLSHDLQVSKRRPTNCNTAKKQILHSMSCQRAKKTDTASDMALSLPCPIVDGRMSVHMYTARLAFWCG